MTYFIADTHFGHANIIRYCNRPFGSVEEMNETMIRKWNDRVAPGDIVWHLGDFALGSLHYIYWLCSELNGSKRLVLGNHDRHSKSAYLKAGFDLVTRKVAELTVDGVEVKLTHRMEETEPRCDRIALHGHSHGRAPLVAGVYDVGVERLGYEPKTLEEILR